MLPNSLLGRYLLVIGNDRVSTLVALGIFRFLDDVYNNNGSFLHVTQYVCIEIMNVHTFKFKICAAHTIIAQ